MMIIIIIIKFNFLLYEVLYIEKKLET